MKQKGEHTYREIYLQPEAFEAINHSLQEVYQVLDQVFAQGPAYDSLIFTGCGTSFYLAQSAAHIFAGETGIPARAVPCSELYFFPETYLGDRKVLVVPMTRKSVTTEVRMAIDRVRQFPSVTTLSITCDPGSATYNDAMILSPEAGEESVVMTRSFSSMLYLATVMALYVGGKTGELDQMQQTLPGASKAALPVVDAFIGKIVAEHLQLDLYVILGQGEMFGVAAESMNKVKEMGLAHSEAYHSLEYRHGPMSIADSKTLVLTLAHSASLEYDRNLLAQMKGLGAVTAVIGEDVSSFQADYRLSLHSGLQDAGVASVVSAAGQLLGYHVAAQKGLDADTPRNLSQAIVL